MSRLVSLLDEHPSVLFLTALAVILVVKWPTLYDPPVWDTAMGLFPAALTLSANNFDLLELLAMPTYVDGGPNVHSTSLVTLITAAVLSLTGGGPQSFLVIRLLHFAAAAYTLVALAAFVKPVFGRGTAPLLCLAVLLFPLVSVQVGYMYFEIPLLLSAVCALRAWTERRIWAAILWATAAVSIKEAGIIVPATLAVAVLLEDQALRLKAKRLAMIMTPPLVLIVGIMFLQRVAPTNSTNPLASISRGHAFLSMVYAMSRWGLRVPDLWMLFLLFLAGLPLFGRGVLQTLRRPPAVRVEQDPDERGNLVLGYSGVLVVVFILLFTVALPVLFRFPFVLPRYSVVVAPFLLLWSGYIVKSTMSARFPSAVAVCLGLLCGWFGANSNGALYPLDINTGGPGNDHALTERSNAYRRQLAVELQAIRAVKALPDGVLVLYGHYEHYLLNYPGLGFADGPLSNGHNLYIESLDEITKSAPMPPCVYALYSYPWLGGGRILDLIKMADTDADLTQETIQEFRDGPYTMSLIRFQQTGAVCAR